MEGLKVSKKKDDLESLISESERGGMCGMRNT